ncbi:MAG TPA: hypothetical protein VIK05_09670 [Ilumatobacteraceae bacterium]
MDVSSLRTIIAGSVLVDVDACRRELEQLRVVRGLADAREVEVLARLDEFAIDAPTIFPEHELAEAAKSSLTNGLKIRHRKQVCERVPELSAALADGAASGERVDVVRERDRWVETGRVGARRPPRCRDRRLGQERDHAPVS